jgi:cysteinyl-tRNA synthetase
MVDGGKMSKSLGNLYTISDLEGRGYHPMIVKYSLIMGHYKQTLNFTFDSLKAAKIGLDRLAKLKSELIGLAGSLPACNKYKDFVKEGPVNLGFFNKAWCSLLEDLNTAKALGALFSAVKELESSIRSKTLGSKEAGEHLHGLLFISEALGIKIPTIEEQHVQIPSKIKELAKQRWQAKMNKNWKEADRLRKELESSGWQIKDLKDNFELLPL